MRQPSHQRLGGRCQLNWRQQEIPNESHLNDGYGQIIKVWDHGVLVAPRFSRISGCNIYTTLKCFRTTLAGQQGYRLNNTAEGCHQRQLRRAPHPAL